MGASWAVAGTAKARAQTAHKPQAIQSKQQEILGYVVMTSPFSVEW
jgi:hypothetical protein